MPCPRLGLRGGGKIGRRSSNFALNSLSGLEVRRACALKNLNTDGNDNKYISPILLGLFVAD